MTDSASKALENKKDYQLKWILANKNNYQDKYVLAAKNELARRDSSLYVRIKQLLNSFFHGV